MLDTDAGYNLFSKKFFYDILESKDLAYTLRFSVVLNSPHILVISTLSLAPVPAGPDSEVTSPL